VGNLNLFTTDIRTQLQVVLVPEVLIAVNVSCDGGGALDDQSPVVSEWTASGCSDQS